MNHIVKIEQNRKTEHTEQERIQIMCTAYLPLSLTYPRQNIILTEFTEEE